MTGLEPLHYATAALLALLSCVAIVYRFYWGAFQRHIRRLTGVQEIVEKVEDVEQNTNSLKADHEETMDKIETLQRGQVAIAETVADEHNGVAVEKLREAHFGERERVSDFRRGESPYGDD